MSTTGNVAEKIVKFARSKLNTKVQYGPGGSGKCEELVKAALDHAGAAQGLKVISAKPGDIVTFKNHVGTVTFDVLASNQPGTSTSVAGFDATFTRNNHIGIVSAAADTNGKISVLEQNVGNTKKVTESPVNTKNRVSYSKKYPAGTSFTQFKNGFTALIRSECTVEKADAALQTSVDWKTIKLWFDPKFKPKYSFTITVSYSGNGAVQYYRPHKTGN